MSSALACAGLAVSDGVHAGRWQDDSGTVTLSAAIDAPLLNSQRA